MKFFFLLIFASLSAHAQSTTASTATTTTDNMYPCNISVKRPSLSQVSIQQLDASGSNVSSASGTVFATVQAENLAQGSGVAPITTNLTASSSGDWVSLFPIQSQFQYQILQVSFSESMETLGVSYQISFCYAGPVATSTTPALDTTTGSYRLALSFDSGITGNSVLLSGSMKGACDLRNLGSQSASRQAAEPFPSVLESDINFSVNFSDLSSGPVSDQYTLNTLASEVPRFCWVNMEIDENSNQPRPWTINFQTAQMTLQIGKN
jgi:hypothetical protein